MGYRVTKFSKFGLVKGRTFANPAAHPHPSYMGVEGSPAYSSYLGPGQHGSWDLTRDRHWWAQTVLWFILAATGRQLWANKLSLSTTVFCRLVYSNNKYRDKPFQLQRPSNIVTWNKETFVSYSKARADRLIHACCSLWNDLSEQFLKLYFLQM